MNKLIKLLIIIASLFFLACGIETTDELLLHKYNMELRVFAENEVIRTRIISPESIHYARLQRNRIILSGMSYRDSSYSIKFNTEEEAFNKFQEIMNFYRGRIKNYSF